MSLAPWRSPLARALHRNRSLSESRYFQLATLRTNGRPANRTVVFRGFFQDSDQLMVVTDSRSEKVIQLMAQPWAEACWYFTKTREQFRLLGQLKIINDTQGNPVEQAARAQIWQQLSQTAQAQFFWPKPGLVKTATDQAELKVKLDPGDKTQLPGCFGLMLLNPTWVDHLDLSGTPHNRDRYSLDAQHQWIREGINP